MEYTFEVETYTDGVLAFVIYFKAGREVNGVEGSWELGAVTA